MKFEQGILTTAEEQLRLCAATLRYQCMATRLQISTIVADVGISFRVFYIWNNFLANLSKLTIRMVNIGLNLYKLGYKEGLKINFWCKIYFNCRSFYDPARAVWRYSAVPVIIEVIRFGSYL